MRMKTMIASACLLTCAVAQAGAANVGDTLVIEKVEKVKIETRDTVQRIVINGQKDHPEFQYVQRISIPDTSAVRRTIRNVKDFNKVIVRMDASKKKLGFSPHVNLGMGTMLSAPDGYKFRVWPSWEIGVTLTANWRPFGRKNVWSLGFGIDWRNFRSDKETRWVKTTDDVMELQPYLNSVTTKRTNLNRFSLTVPVTYTHYFSDKRNAWGITLGAIVNFNTGAHAEAFYESGDYSYREYLYAIGQRVVTFDGIAIVHIPSFLSVYCKYSPSTFFKDDRGPKMHVLTFGLCL